MRRPRPRTSGLFPNLGFGLGLRPDHYSDVLNGRSRVSWFEVVSENYLGDGGRPISVLEKLRTNYPIALHGVSLSIASIDPIQEFYLKKLKNLIDRIEPAIVSDHCCWSGLNGENLHDLMPFPFTEKTLKYVISRVKKVQDFLGRRILLENVSTYLTFNHSEMTEWEFLSELSAGADCGLILDVNNVFVNSVNHRFDPAKFLNGLPPERIGQVHLAGHSIYLTNTGRKFLVDTHDEPVCEDVWELYRDALERFGMVSTMVEWDSNIPEYEILEAEIDKARKIDEEVHGLRRAPQKPRRISEGLSSNGYRI